jgi:hypothetical protein
MVQLTVIDDADNTNFCMVEVEVQDKLDPYIECPEDEIVSCDFWFEAQDTGNDFIDPADDPLTPIFGNAVASDNCDYTISVRIRIKDNCAGDGLGSGAPADAVRRIDRTFKAVDSQGNDDDCTQTIWVVDYDRFDESDIDWANDKLYTTCPEEIPVDYPGIDNDNCSLIGVTYDDERFDIIEDACFKILRHWTVIDWCQYDGTGAGYWPHTQVIKVRDNDGPAFEDCPESPPTFCTEDTNVELPSNNQVFLGEADPTSSSCSVHLTMDHLVVESCSEYVLYDVKVFLNNGSVPTQIVPVGTEVAMDEDNTAVLELDTKSAQDQIVRKYGLPYNSAYCLPNGEKDYHRVLWSVEDGCGNQTTCEYLFRLEDCKQPTPVCINGLSTVVMPSAGEVTIWAVDFNASSFDDCTPAAALDYSFLGSQHAPSAKFACDCDEVTPDYVGQPCYGIAQNQSHVFEIEIWVADHGNDLNCNGSISWSEQNKDFCTTYIIVDDNEDVCENSGSAAVGGILKTEDAEAVGSAEVNVTGPLGNSSFTTSADGAYSFDLLQGVDYTIQAARNDNPMNGVSTLDLVGIQKHLLGIAPFDSPYKLIAADANNSESVSAIDLVELRKLILGIYTELPNNSSWRFVNGTGGFENPSNPWPIDEMIEIVGLSENMMDNDFMGVKIGDVNSTVVANAQSIEERGSNEVLKLYVSDQAVEAGKTYNVTFTSDNFSDHSELAQRYSSRGWNRRRLVHDWIHSD